MKNKLPSHIQRLEMNAKLRKEDFTVMTLRKKIKKMRWGTCCGKPVQTAIRNIDVGNAVIKNVPVGVCEVCGNEYENLFFMADLENLPIRSLKRVLG